MIFEVDLKHVPTIVEEQVIVDPPVTPPVVSESGPRRVIIDTDWWTDIDDGVAFRIAAWAERAGMIDIVAAVLDASQFNSAPSLDEMLTNDGVEDLVIGLGRYLPHEYGKTPPYQKPMTREFTEGAYSVTNKLECEEAVKVYRRALASSSKKTDIISIGFLTNINDLLKSSGDEHSDLNGQELVAEKVGKIWIVGGNYPTTPKYDLNGDPIHEYNFRGDHEATKYVCENSPVQLAFLGAKEGQTIKTGQTLNTDVNGAPVPRFNNDVLALGMANHDLDGQTWKYGNSSWDPIMTLIAAFGNPFMFGYKVEYGYNTIDDVEVFGHNTWTQTDNPEDDFRVINNVYDYGTQDINNEPYEAFLNGILEKDNVGIGSTRWPAVRADLGLERLPKLPRDNGHTDDANMIVNWSTKRFDGYPVGEEVYKINDLSAYKNALIRKTQLEAPLKEEINGSNAIRFYGSTTLHRMVSKNTIQIQNESTFYIRLLHYATPATYETVLGQTIGGTYASNVWRIGIGYHYTGSTVIGAYRWPGPSVAGGTGVTAPVSLTLNTWNTIAVRFVTIAGLNYIEAFWNGVKAGSTVLYNGNFTVADQHIGVGNKYSFQGDGERFNGSISDIRIYNGAHNDDTIAQVLSELG